MKAARKGFNLIFKASKPMATRSIDKCALGYIVAIALMVPN